MSHLFRSAGDHECTPPPSTAPTIQGKDLKAWYTTAQNAIQEARRWKETSREKDVKDLEAKVRCLEAVVRVSKGERDVARKQERRYKDEVERLNVAARDLLAVVREVAKVAIPVGVTPSDDPWWKGHEEAMRRVRVQLAPLTETAEGEEK